MEASLYHEYNAPYGHWFSMPPECEQTGVQFQQLARPPHQGSVTHPVCAYTCVWECMIVDLACKTLLHFEPLMTEHPGYGGFFFTSEDWRECSTISLLTMFAKDLTGCFSHRCVEGGDH